MLRQLNCVVVSACCAATLATVKIANIAAGKIEFGPGESIIRRDIDRREVKQRVDLGED